ncbi:MAG: hypothetical protein E6Q75_02450 [Rheinheimera sp.]|nr:MAG: hypothetical protein E6Q75_02450 [Rheinheimera sp.]
MSANKIAETSSSTGTGNFTLAGAWSVPSSFITGNRTFNSFYGLNHRFPYMIQDQLGNWEKGLGFLSAASTLVRETVIDNSLNTTALIDFPAGDKLVMVPSDAGGLWPETLDSGVPMFSATQYGFASSARALVLNRLLLSSFLLARPMLVTGMKIEVTTAVASSSIKPLIYKAKNQSAVVTMNLISVGEAIDSSTTGEKVSTVNPVYIAAGQYQIGVVGTGGQAVRCNNAGSMYIGWDNGFNAAVNATREIDAIAGSYNNPPSVIQSGGGPVAQAVRVGLLGRLL